MRQRLALEPEWVPAPQDAAPVRDLWTLALPASGVLGVAALLAWVVVSVPSVTHVVRAAFPGMLASTDSQTSVPPSGVTAAASVASSSGVEKAAPEPPNRTVAAAEPLEELTDPREQPLPAPSAGAANIETLADQQTSPAEQAPPAPAHEVTMAERRSAPDFVVTRQLDRDELASMLRRADDFIKSGDLSSARLLLQRAAEAGSVQAALTLAGTFDPNVLAALGFQDSAADIAMARVWYEHAEQFGSSEARDGFVNSRTMHSNEGSRAREE
jgi:hypothetical protein